MQAVGARGEPLAFDVDGVREADGGVLVGAAAPRALLAAGAEVLVHQAPGDELAPDLAAPVGAVRRVNVGTAVVDRDLDRADRLANRGLLVVAAGRGLDELGVGRAAREQGGETGEVDPDGTASAHGILLYGEPTRPAAKGSGPGDLRQESGSPQPIAAADEDPPDADQTEDPQDGAEAEQVEVVRRKGGPALPAERSEPRTDGGQVDGQADRQLEEGRGGSGPVPQSGGESGERTEQQAQRQADAEAQRQAAAVDEGEEALRRSDVRGAGQELERRQGGALRELDGALRGALAVG